MNRVPHDPTNECRDTHCYSHMADEPSEGNYMACPECFHSYRTAGELRREYRRQYRRIMRPTPPSPPCELFGGIDTFGPPPSPPLWRRVWHLLTIRAKDIAFCQHCTHDF